MNKKAYCFFSFIGLAMACNRPCPPVAPAKECPIAIESPMYAKINGQMVELSGESVDPEFKKELEKLENEHRQTVFRMKSMALNEAVDRQLMLNEAKKRGISIEELERTEFISKTEPPSENDIKAFYQMNGLEAQGIPLDLVKERIAMLLMGQKLDALRDTFLADLKKSAQIEFFIVPPPIPREKLPLMDASSWGDSTKAKVTIVEYSDFECPYCARAAALIDEVVAPYGDKVLRIFRHFPLPMHERARDAAKSAECARRQGKFWAAHHRLFANQRALTAENLASYMSEAGLDMEKYRLCLADESVGAIIDRDMADGAALNIDGTPTMFVNGMRLEGMPTKEVLKAYIDAEMSQAR